MEIFNFYNVIFSALFQGKSSVTLVDAMIAAGISLGIWLVLFILQGIGLWVMAKRRNIGKRYLAFGPFVSLYYIGRLTGDCMVFGRKMKRPGLYAMIAQILTTLLMAACSVVTTILFVYYGDCYQSSPYGGEWINLPATVEPLRRFLFICGDGINGISGIFVFVYEILLLLLMVGLFRKYAPRNSMFFSFVAFFVPISRFIFIFALRNKEAIDYEAYMRKQREEFMRRQGGYRPYGGNPYGGNPYNGPYGGYGNGGAQQQNTPPPPEDPFAEFGDSGEKKSGDDDFFN